MELTHGFRQMSLTKRVLLIALALAAVAAVSLTRASAARADCQNYNAYFGGASANSRNFTVSSGCTVLATDPTYGTTYAGWVENGSTWTMGAEGWVRSNPGTDTLERDAASAGQTEHVQECSSCTQGAQTVDVVY